MLERVWRKGNPLTLLAGMQIDTATMENSMLLLLLSRFSRVRLCDPIDGSPPGSPVPGILQARTLEWVAISFSNAWKWTCSVVSDSSWPHGLQPTRLLCPWAFPGKRTGVGFLLQITEMLGDLISKSESYYVKEAKVKPKSVYKSLWLISDNSICFPKELYWLKMIPEPKIVLLHFFGERTG